MYEVRVKLMSHYEHIKFYSMWGAMEAAQKYGACKDVVAVDVSSLETGEVGMIIENGKLTFIAENEF